jgi:hypothetical protein
MKPFFTYFGGKYRVAPKYPSPIHDTIIEPFAGSAGYSVRNYNKNVILYDLDEKIIGLWKYLISVKQREIMSLPTNISDGLDSIPNVCEEAKWLIGFWLNKGTSSPSKSPSLWMRQGIRPNSFWGDTIRNRIAFQVEKIRHWKAIHSSYQNIERNYTATWFVDPPYEKAGKDYKHSSKMIDFQHLGEWCRFRNGQVIVCENAGAEWLPFKPFLTIKGTEGKNRSGDSREVIWYQDDGGLLLLK